MPKNNWAINKVLVLFFPPIYMIYTVLLMKLSIIEGIVGLSVKPEIDLRWEWNRFPPDFLRCEIKVGLRHKIKSKIENMPSQAFLVSAKLNRKRTSAF